MMSRLLKLALLFAIILTPAQTVLGQACGNIYAKFFVQDAAGKFVDSARFRMLRRDSDESIMYAETEISTLASAGAYQFRHGLCGSHRNTRLFIDHQDFETFEHVIDLPLNSPRTEHVFSIRLKRKGSRDTASIEQWAMLTGEAHDAEGNRLANVLLFLTGKDGETLERRSSEYGIFSFHVKKGEYALEGQLPSTGERIKHDHLELKPGYNSRDIKFSGVGKKN